MILAKNSPDALITSIDISEDSLKRAQEKNRKEGITNVTFRQGDIYHLLFEPESFDHIFVCFVLEHVADPVLALKRLHPLLKKGGTITVIEGDHGSTFFHPENVDARRAIDCLVDSSAKVAAMPSSAGTLPAHNGAGFSDVHISPRMVYVDSSRPALVEGFTRLTFTAMVEGVAEDVWKHGLMTKDAWERGIAALYLTADDDGVFCYTFFKATGYK